MSEITMVVHGRSVIPFDGASYEALRSSGITSTRINIDTFATVADLKKLQVKYIDFYEGVFVPHMKRVYDVWVTTPSHKFKANRSVIVLETINKSVQASAIEKLPKAKENLERFMRRWGLSCEVTSSDAYGKHKLHIKYWASDTRFPVVPVSSKYEQEPKEHIIDFGFARVVIKCHRAPIHIAEFQVKCGLTYKVIYKTRCLPSQIDASSFLNLLSKASK